MTRSLHRCRAFLVLAALVMALPGTPCLAISVLPEDEVLARTGSDLPALARAWWQWLADIPKPESPLDSENGGCRAQSGEIFNLAALEKDAAFAAAQRSCELDLDRIVLLSVFAAASIQIDGCEMACELPEKQLSEVEFVQIFVDGEDVSDLILRSRSEDCLSVRVPPDNIFGTPKPEIEICTAGYWLVLADFEPGVHAISLDVSFFDGSSYVVEYTLVTSLPFRRGDSNGDGQIDLSDAIRTLLFLFAGASEPRCASAADANASGELDLSDAVFLLAHLFTSGPAPPHPGPYECGIDPEGRTSCQAYDGCRDALAVAGDAPAR